MQRIACYVLFSLVSSRDDLLDGGVVRHDPLAAAAIEPAVAALRLWGSHTRDTPNAAAREKEVHAVACALLAKIAKQSAAMATCAGSSGAVEAVVAAMSGSGHSYFASAALRALDKLTSSHEQNSAAACRAGAVPKVAEFCRKHNMQQWGDQLVAALQQPAAQAADAVAAELLAAEEAAERSRRPQQSKRSGSNKKHGGNGSAQHATGGAAEAVTREQLAALSLDGA
jgi:hypothetical protein